MSKLRQLVQIGYYGAIMYLIVKVVGHLDIPFWPGVVVITCCGSWFFLKTSKGAA